MVKTATKAIRFTKNDFEWGTCWNNGNVYVFPPEYEVSDKDGHHPIGKWLVSIVGEGRLWGFKRERKFTHYCDVLDYVEKIAGCPVEFETSKEK